MTEFEIDEGPEYIIGDLDMLELAHYNIAATFADRESLDKFFGAVEKVFLFRYQGMLISFGDEGTIFRIEELNFER